MIATKIGKFHGPKARKAIKHLKDLVYGLYSIGLSFMDKFIFWIYHCTIVIYIYFYKKVK